MKALLIDIGNTLIKMAGVNNKDEIREWTSVGTKGSNVKEQLKTVFFANRNCQFAICVISCVVPAILLFVQKLVNKTYQLNAIVVNGQLIKPLLNLNVDNPQIGSDLLALALGVQKKYGKGIVISLGTATTYNIVVNKQLQGVIIGPGFSASKDALVANAALLSDFKIGYYESMLGKNTNHALSIGYGYGFSTMIKGTITKIEKELQMQLPIILTGGAAMTLISYFDFPYFFEPQMVMIGLLVVAQYFLNKKNDKK